MRISLNLASRPFTDLGPANKRLRIGMGILAGLSILFAIGLHLFDNRAAEARAREHSLDGRIARIQAERETDEATMRRPDNAQLLEQAQTLNQLFDAKAFSWTLAMEAMETVLPAGVQVTAIEPIRAKDGHITVHLRVVGAHDRVVELVRNLEHSRRFLLPRIVGESAESSNGPNQRPEPVSASNRFNFDLLAEYNPPTPEERIEAKKAARMQTASAANPARSHSVPPGYHVPAVRPPYIAPSSSQPGMNPPNSRKPNPGPGGPQ